ncbi:YveK family protein [Listeria sp. ILCC792]|uniref:YveK family protein n=1 Tax=Listeria sp. ILCC792 TaxID=1918331 RepID=UPI000B58CC46|nr:Wzz/FepE/Etk N-terminal domain-containing protein [Listeria sp. ILCC792]
MNEQIDLKQIMLAIRKNGWWIVGIVTMTVLCMFIYLQYIATPIYQKSTQILVNQSESSPNDSLDSQTVQADLQLVDTYSSIILSPRILNGIEQDLGNLYDTEELAEMIQVTNATNSQVIDISVKNPDPKLAAQIANSTAKVFTKEMPSIMKVDNVTTLSEAQFLGNETPIAPQKTLLLILAVFMGLFFAFCFIFIRLLFKRTFTSADEIEEILQLNVLGEVSTFHAFERAKKRLQKGAR